MLNFIFILGEEEYKVKFKTIFQMKLKGIDKESMKERKYIIKTPIKKENFELFLEFLKHCSFPNIDISNLNEMKDLSEELQIKGLNTYISTFEDKIMKDKQIIYNLKNNNYSNENNQNINQDNSKYIEYITKNLDFFLNEYWEIMKILEFKEIFEIFHHEKRKLINEDKGYEFIKEKIEETNQDEYYLIYQSFHIENMSEEIINEIYSNLEDKEIEFVPQFHKTFLNKTVINIEITLKNEIKKLEEEYKKKQEKDKEKYNQMIKEMKEMKDTIFEEKENYKMIVEKQQEKINEMTAILLKQGKQIKEITTEILAIKSQNNSDYMKNLKNEIENKNMKEEINSIKNKIDQKADQTLLDKITEKIREMNTNKRIKFEKSEYGGGILKYLKEEDEKENSFKPSFISSLSSRDPYDLMRTNWENAYFSGSSGKFFIEFEIEQKQNINGILIKSANRRFMKGYQILVDENIIYETDGNVESEESLNGINKEIKINFENEMEGRKIKIVQKGKNWDFNNNSIGLRRIEIYSEEHPEGIFESMRKELHSQQNQSVNDPHLFPVKITAYYYSLESFYLFNSKKYLNTDNKDKGCFEINFMKGIVLLNGYRLGRANNINNKFAMKGWKIEGQTLFDEEWREIEKFSETDENKKNACDVYKIDSKLKYKKIRLIHTEPNYDKTCNLALRHIELFGEYIEVEK